MFVSNFINANIESLSVIVFTKKKNIWQLMYANYFVDDSVRKDECNQKSSTQNKMRAISRKYMDLQINFIIHFRGKSAEILCNAA